MRLLVYGLQASGASTLAMLLAQRPGCVALVDIPLTYAAPRLATGRDVIAKCVVTTAYPLAVHVERFRPDRVLLHVREPAANHASLSGKAYRNQNGLIDEKFGLLEQVFAAGTGIDGIIAHEDVAARRPGVLEAVRRCGWPLTGDAFDLPRGRNDILAAVWAAEPDLLQRLEFSFGDHRDGGIRPGRAAQPVDPAVRAHVERLCPTLCAWYDRRIQSREAPVGWH